MGTERSDQCTFATMFERMSEIGHAPTCKVGFCATFICLRDWGGDEQVTTSVCSTAAGGIRTV